MARAGSVAIALVVVLVLSGTAASLIAGLRAGVDLPAALILAGIASFAAVSIALVRRTKRGAARPRLCQECEGLVSYSAPYCKHCGARLPRENAARRKPF